MTPSVLASELRQCRIASGLTLEQLAGRARLSRSTIAKIEAGDTPDPGYSVVARLLDSVEASDEQILKLHREVTAARRPRVLGIGYEGLDLPGLVAQLRARHVEVVVDVRLTPLSRKPGLSKTALSAGLRQARIDYLHLPALGNPKENRPGYRDAGNRAPRDKFLELLKTTDSAAQLDRLRELATTRVVAVLCFEGDERMCHRQQVLAAVG